MVKQRKHWEKGWARQMTGALPNAVKSFQTAKSKACIFRSGYPRPYGQRLTFAAAVSSIVGQWPPEALRPTAHLTAETRERPGVRPENDA